MAISEIAPYEMEQAAKLPFMLAELNRLTSAHYCGCPEYRRLLDVLHGGCHPTDTLEAIPYMPVRLFKQHDLLSVPPRDVVKTMTSSGTSGQSVSKIFLDKFTASFQIKVLAGIVSSFIGKHRLPMLVIDCPSTVSNRLKFSARTAGILGFSMFGRNVTYALTDDMKLDVETIAAFLERHANEDILVFGFTAIVWEHLVQQLDAKRMTLPLSRAILLHGGGWKKLLSLAVTNDDFKTGLARTTGIRRVHNYYGMVEQTGSIFMECEAGHLHSSNHSEIIIRNPIGFNVRGIGEPGLIQLLSVIPHSYPGHSLLSEDMGELIGIDSCHCGRKGKTFKVHGRIKNAEVRGCSDTYTR
ncbi:MAG: acyl-protein synthetase [Comamonadaceae bacterium]|nr:acyl-protein synthetase [Comamonadaceae bacterium]